jgi:capsular polysaccharide transport system ATP-binding protein
MSVRLENVTKLVRVGGRSHVLFDRIDLEIGPTSHIGILALPKSGKTTLLRMICGMEQPDSGRIRKDMRVSWPIPSSDFAVASSSIAWNIRSMGRIYGVRDRDFVQRVGELGGLTKHLNLPLGQCPPLLRTQLAFAVGIGMDFGLYLFDNQAASPKKEFRAMAIESLRKRTEGRALLLATSAPNAVADICDSVYVLEQGRVTHFPDPEEAVEHFKTLLKAEKERQKEQREQEDPDDEYPDMASEEGDRSVEVVAAALSDF